MTEPEQWAVELWAEMYAAVYGCEPTQPAHMYANAHRILQRAFEERERKLREALEKGVTLIDDYVRLGACRNMAGLATWVDEWANEALQALKETPDAQ